MNKREACCPCFSDTNKTLRNIVLGVVFNFFSLSLVVASVPNSPVIVGFQWAPASSIVRQAKGSDCWPITWAADDHLYTAYGDGYGFEPLLSSKLSLGFGRVEGNATEFLGYNIRSSSGEQEGDGKVGKKPSGMLFLDGVLYMWVRNADNNGNQSQLAWSTDHAKTWIWSSWKWAEFGMCTFVNYGKNYAGARDNYVYVVSHDLPNAYAFADSFILMRVPKDKITIKSDYKIYAGLDGDGNPIWSSDIAQRKPIFTNPGECQRSGLTYNSAIGRYLWYHSGYAPGDDRRFSGPLGIYDAPEPWGPWTLAYYSALWDVGPGESGGFPSKWMSEDGLTVHLVFSGDDYFSVRKATLTIAGSETPPHAPSELMATAMSSSQIDLSWIDNSMDELGFKLERRLGNLGNWEQTATVGVNIKHYQDTNLLASQQYFYRVYAFHATADSVYSNLAEATTLAVGANVPPLAYGDWELLEGFTVRFSSSRSHDPDGHLVAFEWKLEDVVLSTDASFEHDFVGPGIYGLSLRVQDDQAAWSQPALVTVDLGGQIEEEGPQEETTAQVEQINRDGGVESDSVEPTAESLESRENAMLDGWHGGNDEDSIEWIGSCGCASSGDDSLWSIFWVVLGLRLCRVRLRFTRSSPLWER